MELYTNKPSSPVAWSVGLHWGWWPDCDPFLDVLLRPYNSIVPFLLKGLVCTVTKRTWRNYDVVEILKRSRRIGRVRSSVYWVVLLNNNKKKEKKRRDGRCFHCDGAFCFSLSLSLSLSTHTHTLTHFMDSFIICLYRRTVTSHGASPFFKLTFLWTSHNKIQINVLMLILFVINILTQSKVLRPVHYL